MLRGNCRLLSFFLISSLLLVVNCAGGNNNEMIAGDFDARTDTAPVSIPQLNLTDSGALPSPEEALASLPLRSSSAAVLERNGNDYGRDPHGQPLTQNVTNEGSSARFSPAWTDEAPDVHQLAYAIYSFNVEGYAGNNVIQLNWASPPPDDGDQWVGLSCWSDDSWVWFSVSDDGEVSLDGRGFTDYSDSDTGEMLVAVILLGSFEALLEQTVSHERAPLHWLMFGHNRAHTRRSLFAGAQTNSLKWSFQTMGKISSSPAIDDNGTVYVANHVKYDIGGCVGNLYAVNPNGTEKWSCPIGSYVTSTEYVISSPAISSDGTVYVGSLDNRLYAIDSDGSLKWTYETGDRITSSPVVDAEGTVYVGSHDGNLYAVNPSGSLKWSYATGGDVNSSPAVDATGTVYIGSSDYKLCAINPDGSLKWSCTTMSPLDSSPMIGWFGIVYVGSWICPHPDDMHGRLYAINPDGTAKSGNWPFYTDETIISSPAFGAYGVVYVGSGNKLYAVNQDGSLQWSYTTDGWNIVSSPAIGGDGTVYVGGSDNKLYAVNPDGSLKWSYTTGDQVRSSPAICADGTVYVGSDDGKLYAFGQ